LASCAQTDDTGHGFGLSADQLRRTPTTEAPDPWLVEVATAKLQLTEIVAYRERPQDDDKTDAQALNAPAAVEVGDLAAAVAGGTEELAAPGGLTPIPSPDLSWDSTAIDGGWSFQNPTRIGNPRVFAVTEERGDWLEVMVPTRPNQQTGWIRASDVTLSTHRWHVEIDVTANRLRAWEGDELKIETVTVDGKPTTPTPLGRYYFNEQQVNAASSVYGPYIVSTNGFSDTLERFSGEVPIFAVHGTNNPDAMGTDVSNGCVRVPNDIIQRIAYEVPLGTPVDIVV
jgi:hypothetical protein